MVLAVMMDDDDDDDDCDGDDDDNDGSVVECRTRNRESPGSNPLCYLFDVWAFSFSSRRLSPLSCITEYLHGYM